MHVPKYRYLLCDLLTDQPVAMLPLTGVTFGRRISRPGSLSATLNCSSSRALEVGRTLYAYAGRAALWVYRNDALWWGGIPWTVTAKRGTRGPVQVSVTAATFDSYAHRRRLYTTKVYNAVDQGVIIPDLWRTIQQEGVLVPYGDVADIGVVAEDQPTGVLRDRTYFAADFPYVGKLVEDLGDVIDGPEHTIDVYADSAGARVKRLRVANTLAGDLPPTVVFQSSNVLEWEETADAVDGGTVFQARGNTTSTEGDVGSEVTAPMSGVSIAQTLIESGWPVLDVTSDHSDVSDVATLDGYALAARAEQSGAEQVHGYTVNVGATGWSPNRLGEQVRIKVSDDWHGNIDRTVRPVGVEVKPGERGQAEQVQLILGGDE